MMLFLDLTSSAELHHLAPLGHQVVPVRLPDSCLNSDTVLSPWAEEPVSSNRHGERHSLGHKLSWHILDEKVMSGPGCRIVTCCV